MKINWMCIAGVALCGFAAAAKPQITEKTGVRTLAAVSEAATLSRGSAFTITGKDLAPPDAAKADVPYPQDLGGVSVALTTADGSAVVQA
ncbi:MAG: hypothetical protein HZB13_19555 [Acidobacteria bacterium]|nr:hypothetical protein [Acidobacteriota bacterium]